jgi:hypothetical protein
MQSGRATQGRAQGGNGLPCLRCRTTDLRSCRDRTGRQKSSAVTACSQAVHSVGMARPRASSPALLFSFLLSPVPFSRPSSRFFSCAPMRLVSLVWLSSILPSCASLPCPFSIRFHQQTNTSRLSLALRRPRPCAGRVRQAARGSGRRSPSRAIRPYARSAHPCRSRAA